MGELIYMRDWIDAKTYAEGPEPKDDEPPLVKMGCCGRHEFESEISTHICIEER